MLLDRNEYDIDKCFKDGNLMESMKVHGYQQYHKKTFEILKIENTEKMRNEYLSKVKNEYHTKKANAA